MKQRYKQKQILSFGRTLQCLRGIEWTALHHDQAADRHHPDRQPACQPACQPVKSAVHSAVLAFSQALRRAVRVKVKMRVRARDRILEVSHVVRAIHGISGRDDTACRLTHLTAVACFP